MKWICTSCAAAALLWVSEGNHTTWKKSLIERKNCTYLMMIIFIHSALARCCLPSLRRSRCSQQRACPFINNIIIVCMENEEKKKSHKRRVVDGVAANDDDDKFSWFHSLSSAVYDLQTYDFYYVSRSLTLSLVSSCFLSINVDFAINNYRQCLSFVCRKFQCIENSMHLRVRESCKINFNW